MTLYARTYYRYGAKSFDTDDNLEDLCGQAHYDTEWGEASTVGFWRLGDKPGEWIPVDDEADPIMERLDRAESEKSKASMAAEKVKPWWLIRVGPDGYESHWSTHETQEEAVAAGADWVALGGLIKTQKRPGA